MILYGRAGKGVFVNYQMKVLYKIWRKYFERLFTDKLNGFFIDKLKEVYIANCRLPEQNFHMQTLEIFYDRIERSQ